MRDEPMQKAAECRRSQRRKEGAKIGRSEALRSRGLQNVMRDARKSLRHAHFARAPLLQSSAFSRVSTTRGPALPSTTFGSERVS